MSPALQVLLAGLGTYAIRVSAIALSERFEAPSAHTEATLRLIAPAVLAAIVADQLVVADGEVAIDGAWRVAGVVAGLVAWRWKSAGLTMAVGIATVWLVAWVL